MRPVSGPLWQRQDRLNDGVDPAHPDSQNLNPKLGRVTEEETIRATRVDGGGGKESSCQSSPGSADAVDSEDIQSVVHLELASQLDCPVADDASAQSDQ